MGDEMSCVLQGSSQLREGLGEIGHLFCIVGMLHSTSRFASAVVNKAF